MKFVVAPDSFKGALSAADAAAAISRGIRRAVDAEIVEMPVADGGEGTVDAMLAAVPSGSRIAHRARGPQGEEIETSYGFLDSTTAVVEMAATAGLPLVGDDLDVANATTFGVGQQIADAVRRGASHLLIGAGGSATNDVGCGVAAALGVRFLDATGSPFVPVGGTLHRVASIDVSAVPHDIRAAKFTVLADIDNPLLGDRGAAAVFAPQKGADAECVQRLEAGAAHIAGLFREQLGADVADAPGAGAAGGFAAGLMALFGAEVNSGINALLDAAGFDAAASGTTAIITAEGQIDGQSLSGKVPVGVARRAAGVPVFVLAGSVGSDMAAVYDEGVTAVFPIGQGPQSLGEAMANTAENLERSAENLVRTLQVFD